MIGLVASSVGTYDFTVSIDGSLNSSGVAKTNASNLGSGSYRSTSVVSGAPCRIEFTGLSLGLHTITIQRSAGTGNFGFGGVFVITPIHSARSSSPADLQNTLPVGSCALSDSRLTGMVESEQPKRRGPRRLAR